MNLPPGIQVFARLRARQMKHLPDRRAVPSCDKSDGFSRRSVARRVAKEFLIKSPISAWARIPWERRLPANIPTTLRRSDPHTALRVCACDATFAKLSLALKCRSLSGVNNRTRCFFILPGTWNFDLGAFHFFVAAGAAQKNTESSSPKLNFLQGFAVELFLCSAFLCSGGAQAK